MEHPAVCHLPLPLDVQSIVAGYVGKVKHPVANIFKRQVGFVRFYCPLNRRRIHVFVELADRKLRYGREIEFHHCRCRRNPLQELVQEDPPRQFEWKPLWA